jgi:hypothetical protein
MPIHLPLATQAELEPIPVDAGAGHSKPPLRSNKPSLRSSPAMRRSGLTSFCKALEQASVIVERKAC